MSAKLSRRMFRAQHRAPFGAKHAVPDPPVHFDDNCPLCRMAREEGLETHTTALPNGKTSSITVVPRGWKPPTTN